MAETMKAAVVHEFGKPLVDWLTYNAFTVVTKPVKAFTDVEGRRKLKGNMDVELAVDAMRLAPHLDHIVLFSGDGDFRSLVAAIQERGKRVSVVSSLVTQPPMIAEAVVQIGAKLPLVERRSWYRQIYPNLLAYHQWLYTERDPHGEGLALLIHPWETGLDTTPPWMGEMQEHLLPWWIRFLAKTRLELLLGWFRRDTRYVHAHQRPTNIEAMALYDAQRRLRRKEYNINKILDHSLFAIEDLAFNSIFVRANERLLEIAKTLRADVPEELLARMKLTRLSFEELWDPYTESY